MSSNALSVFILRHDINVICNKNICLIQDIMRTSDPDGEKFKHICKYFPNMAILTKIATPGDVQLTFSHMSFGNKYLKESITAFALAVSLEAPKVASISVDITFAISGNKIRIPVTEVLLCAAVGNLARLKNRETGWR